MVSGSNIENLGKTWGLINANFSCRASLEMTAPQFISEPVAGKVTEILHEALLEMETDEYHSCRVYSIEGGGRG